MKSHAETDRPASAITPDRDFFDRFAARVAHLVSRGPFFFVCVLGVSTWAAAGALTGYSDRWVAWGSTSMGTAILLLVAILENAQRRSDQAVQRKLNAISDALAEFISSTGGHRESVRELQSAVGLEHRESTNDSHVESVFRRRPER
jgi:low affinity Fe/Cu permease